MNVCCGRLTPLNDAMKSALIFLILCYFAPFLRADIPPPFDPRGKPSKDQKLTGSAFIVRPSALDSAFLILTRPLDNNKEGKWFTYRARLKKGINANTIPYGRFCFIEVVRVKPDKKRNTELEIQKITEILHW